ncbi:hypothetical protein WA158_008472 [Blastocystis sp. Blastoise]
MVDEEPIEQVHETSQHVTPSIPQTKSIISKRNYPDVQPEVVLPFIPKRELRIYNSTLFYSENRKDSIFDYLEEIKEHSDLYNSNTPKISSVNWIKDRFDTLENMKTYKNISADELEDYVFTLRIRLSMCLNTLDHVKTEHDFEQQMTYLNKSLATFSLFKKQEKQAIKFIQDWRKEWPGETYMVTRRYEEDFYIMHLKLNTLGWEYNENEHNFIQVPKLSEKTFNSFMKNHTRLTLTSEHKSWSQRQIMSKSFCEQGPMKKQVDNTVYNRVFNPQELWRNERWYEQETPEVAFPDTLNSIYNMPYPMTVLLCHPNKLPTQLINDLKKYFRNLEVIPINIGSNYTDNGGFLVYETLKAVKTRYIMLLDHTVTLNKYSRLDLLEYAVAGMFVDVVAGSEEDQDHVLSFKCFKPKNQFGKYSYMYGYHNTFYYFSIQIPGIVNTLATYLNGQVCYRGSSYILTRKEVLLSKWKPKYPLPLAIQAFMMDIKDIYTFGSVPYVTLNHVISDENTIYKPLQKLDRSVRQKFGEDYRMSIYIDTEKRFTWMPYLPNDYNIRAQAFGVSSAGMTNPLHFLGSQHDLLIELDKMMREFNIPYTPIAGTLLSAVAFGGIFPWEYDTDYRFSAPNDIDLSKSVGQIIESSVNRTKNTDLLHLPKEDLLSAPARANRVAANRNGMSSISIPRPPAVRNMNAARMKLFKNNYCELLKELKPYLLERLNKSSIAMNFPQYTGMDTCSRLTRWDIYSGYLDMFALYDPPHNSMNIPQPAPYRRVKYLGHLMNIPTNWREMLHLAYKRNYFHSDTSKEKDKPWATCDPSLQSHPNCIKNTDDIYEYIQLFTDEVRYWPRVE